MAEVPFDKKPSDQATLLLAAAEELGLDPSVVQTYEGGFLVPQEVYDTAYPPPKKKSKKKSESEEG
jgi:hypothetical protein